MTATIINGIIALLLGTYAVKYKNTSYVIFILFVYISLHYAYSAIPIFGSSKYVMFYRYLRGNTQVGAKIIGLGFLLFTAGLLFFTNRKDISSAIQLKPTNRIYSIAMIWIVAVGITWVFNISQGEYPSFLAIQDVVSSFIMLILAFIIAAALPGLNKKATGNLEKMLQVLLFLVITMDIVALYQIVAFKTFAGTANKNGEYANRACALLFNPNLLGLWCAFVASVTAYAFHTKRYSQRETSLMLVLTALGIFLSGSRSGLLICLFMLGLITFLQLKYRRGFEVKFSFYPFFVFIASLTGMGIFFKILDSFSKSSFKWLHGLSVLVDRFANMPEEIATYAVFKLNGYMILAAKKLYEYTGSSIAVRCDDYFTGISNTLSTSSVFINIDGRLNPALPIPDNGYLAMYHDNGWPGLLAWLILWMVIVWMGVKAFRINSGINSVYALSAVFTCLFAAIFIRSFQVYPVWIMVSIVLGISLAWFQTVMSSEGFREHS